MPPKTPNLRRPNAGVFSPISKSGALSLAAALSLGTGGALVHGQDAEEESIFELDAFVVQGIRESAIQGVEIKRQSHQMIDALIAEDIGKFPDNNVVEALQRIAGVQVTNRGGGEVSTVSIRGLGDITTTVNGRNIFTASGRSVALADIPASLLNRVDVYKTRSAEHIEQGIAGVIDVKTQRPFYFDGRKVVLAARGIHQDLADETDPNLSALFSNTWETDAGKFGMLFNVSYVETNYRDQSVTAGAMVPFVTDEPPPGFVPYERIFLTHPAASENPIWQPGLEAGLPFAAGSTLNFNGQPYEYLLARDAIFASDFTGKRERSAANVALQFAPSESAEYTFEAFYNGYRNESFNDLLFSFADWWGGLGDNPSANIEVFPGTNVIKSRSNVGFPYGFTSGDMITGKTDSYLYAIGGKWTISDAFKLEADLSYQNSKYDESFLAMRTDRVHSRIDVDFNSGGGLPAFNFGEADDLNNPALWNVAQFYDNALERRGDAVEFTVDGDYNTDWGIVDALRFGLRYDDRAAEEANRFGPDAFLGQPLSNFPELAHVNKGFFDGRSDVPTTWTAASGYYLRDNADEIRTLYGVPTAANQSLLQTFNVAETTTSLYGVADFATELGERKLTGQCGLRYVNVDTDMEFAGGSDSVSTSGVLPSLTVRYDITPDFRVRFSYGETLRRPNFVDLNPTIQYNEDVTNIGYGTASGGNPNLEATESKNYDLAFEYYLGEKAGAVYTTFFRREIEGLVVGFRNRVTYENYDYILSQPDNASNGELEGVEIGWVYFPEDLPGLLDGFGLQASYTILDSVQDIPVTNDAGVVVDTDTTPFFGVSDTSYSVVLAYEKPKYSARWSYVWREDFLNNYEAALFANPLGVYRKPEQSMDFQFTYNLSENLALTFDATNLTDEIFQSYYEYPETHNFGSSIYSRTFALGARYSF